MFAAPPAPAASPPAAAEVAWSARPTAEQVAEAAALYATTGALDRAGVAQMSCVVMPDGSLTACVPGLQPPTDPAFVKPLLKLAASYRADLSRGPVDHVVVTERFPRLVDVVPQRSGKPELSEAELKATNPQGLGGRVELRCTITEAGAVSGCRPEPGEAADAALVAAAVRQQEQTRYTPARRGGRPVALTTAFTQQVRAVGDTTADWLRRPDVDRIAAVIPTEAARRGVDGRAAIRCRVSTAGLLLDCRVIDEAPLGLGFGGAVLSLAPIFAVRPATHAGRPIEEDIVIPVNFKGLGGLKSVRAAALGSHIPSEQREPGLRLASWAPMTAAPALSDMKAAYPPQAAAARQVGVVVFRCSLTADGRLAGCADTQENPLRQGFTAAGRKLLPLFRVDMREVTPQARQSLLLSLTVRFSPEMLAAGVPRSVLTPDWVHGPDPQLMLAQFPTAARAKGVHEGRATVDCAVADDGGLAGCTTVSEAPGGLGFGAAAQTVAQAMQMNRWTRAGEPVGGARIRLPLRMLNTDAAAPDAAAVTPPPAGAPRSPG